MDPLIIATLFKQQVGFLGNASIFVHGIVNAIFKYFGVIPVYRQQDVAPGVAPDNRKTFSACYTHLEEGNAIMMFPEGTSVHELRLRKIKTGTARIALGVEEQNQFELGVKIIPIGLYYDNPSQFGSKIHVNIGQTISANKFKEVFEKDPALGVQTLTEKIKESLEELTINTEDAEQEELFIKIKRLYNARLIDQFNPKDKEEEFRYTKEIANAIQYFKVNFPERFSYLKGKIDQCDLLQNDFKTSAMKVPNVNNLSLIHI